MIDPHSQAQLGQRIVERIADDRALLDRLRREIRPLRSGVRAIQPRTTTAIAFVGTDGGNNSIPFDPFLIELIRVVDSSNNEYCLEAISPTTSVSELSARQFDPDGGPRTPLGKLMAYLGVKHLTELSPMIRTNDVHRPVSPGWVRVYRELVEWAILFSIVRDKDFANDTVLIFDGLLRSVVFRGDLFRRYVDGLQEGIVAQARRSRRSLYLSGVAKSSKVLARYRLAMALERVLTTNYPAYVEVPRELEDSAYTWSEYARGNDLGRQSGVTSLAGGKMFFVKFGSRERDPIWPIDLFLPQADQAATILGYILADARNGFPIPHYPLCLQRAHANAALVDFDYTVLQDQIFAGVRRILGDEAAVIDEFRLQDARPARARYG